MLKPANYAWKSAKPSQPPAAPARPSRAVKGAVPRQTTRPAPPGPRPAAAKKRPKSHAGARSHSRVL